ncbi:MAG: DUF2913 family protein [Candidatus Symbiopectobacterium sp. Dall1.0]|nr:DUF2913 family protein [Candidatus Symbiopectobacterium sp. Dall1.0]
MIVQQKLPPQETTYDLSHLAFCALVALHLAHQDRVAGSLYAENLFLVRWLAQAQKQKRFPKSVSVDIGYLLEKGRQQGPTSKLRQRLEYLWQSCTGEVTKQSDLFRLTFATECLKDQGWNNEVMSDREWLSGRISESERNRNCFYVEKSALNAAYSENGKQLHALEFRVTGQENIFLDTLKKYGLISHRATSSSQYHTVMLIPNK